MDNKAFFLKRYESFGIPQNDALSFKEKQIIRVNTAAINEKKLITRLAEKNIFLEKVPFLSKGYIVSSDVSIVSTIEYLLGYFYIQESSSQIVGECIARDLKESDFSKIRVLDMCASPGGKTTHMSEILRQKGEIIALENNPKRIDRLRYNLERMGSQNVLAFQKDATLFTDENLFDIILLDAPCSGNFTQEKQWFEKRTLKDIQSRVVIQKKLLNTAKTLLKKEGSIYYITCSLEKEENEEVIEDIVEKDKSLTLASIPFSLGEEGLTKRTVLCKRFLPSKGFPPLFIAKLTKI